MMRKALVWFYETVGWIADMTRRPLNRQLYADGSVWISVERQSLVQRLFAVGGNHTRRVGLAVLGIVVVVLIVTVSVTRASVARLYPNECSGTWDQANLAAGKSNGKNPDSDNAAMGDTNHARLMCRDFSGDVPDQVVPEKFFLTLAMRVVDDSVKPDTNPVSTPDQELPVIDEKAINEITPDDTPVDVLGSGMDSGPSTSSSIEGEVVEPAMTESSAPDPIDDTDNNSSSSEPNDAPEPESVSSETVSYLQSLIAQRAYAQETGEIDVHGRDLLEIRYSLDGETWNVLAQINANDGHDARFELNDPNIVQWKDLANLHIEVVVADNADPDVRVYVESVAVEVEYQDAEPDAQPTVELTDDTIMDVESKATFAPGEMPVFVVVDPNLSVADLSGLISENRATIVDDPAGTFDNPGLVEPTDPLPDTDAVLPGPRPEELPASVENVVEQVVSWFTPLRAQANSEQTVDAVLLDWMGNPTDITVVIETIVEDGTQKEKITINKPERQLRPGRYTLRISLHTDTAVLVTEQDFTWGVLAVNMNKSVYHPGDRAYLQMGVLDDEGRTLCDADLAMVITSPSGATASLTTTNGGITKNTDCKPDNVIATPDYFAYHQLGNQTGEYQVRLTAVTDNGTKMITDYFSVANDGFDIERTGPSRIYPVVDYPMMIRVTSDEDWNGVITETVPESFEILPPAQGIVYDNVSSGPGVKIISWNVSLSAGEPVTLGYRFDAPDISPEFYLAGPARLMDSDTIVYQETRLWQIAGDATCTTNGTGGGNWGTGSTWSGCAGAGGIPAAGDNITILATDTVTMNVNSPVLGTITVNGTLNTSNGTSRSLSGTTLTIGSAGTLTANASTITLSGTTGTPLTLTAGGTFNAGTSTIALTGNNASGNTTVPQNVPYYNLTVNNSSETFVMNGTTTVTNVLTVTNGTFTTTGSNHTLTAGRIVLATNTATCVFNANGSTVTLTGSAGPLISKSSTNVFTAGTSTVVVTSSATVALNANPSPTFYNLTLSGSGTINLGVALTVSNIFTITSGTLTTLSGATSNGITASSIDVQSGGTLTLNASTVTLNGSAGDPFSSTGTVNVGTSTVSYTGNNASGNVIISSDVTYYSLTLNRSGEIFELEDDTDLSPLGTLAVSSGTFDTTGSNYAFSAGKIVTANVSTAILNFNGSTVNLTATSGTLFTRASNSIFNAGTSTVVLSGNGNATVSVTAVNSFNNLTLTGTGTKTMGVGITVNGVLTVGTNSILDTSAASNYAITANQIAVDSGGTINLNASALTLNGSSSDPITVTGSINTGTSTISYTGTNPSGTITISDDITYYNLTINNSAETYELEGPTFVTNNTTVTNGTLDTTNNNYALSTGRIVTGTALTTVMVLNASTVTITGTSGTLITRGNNNATISAGSSTILVTGSGTVTLINSFVTTFGSIVLNAAGTKSITTGVTINDTLRVIEGTLALGAGTFTGSGTNTLIVEDGGTIQVNKSTFTGGFASFETRTFEAGSTVEYSLNGTQTVDSTATYADLAITTGGTKSLNGTTTATGTLTVADSTLTTTASNHALSVGSVVITATGTLTANASTITIADDWTNDGTFTAGTSTVLFNTANTATISGTTTFYDLTITHTAAKEVNFATAGSPVFSVTNTFITTGSSGNRIKLYSDSNGTQWNFNPTGTASVDYADIRDGGCEVTAISMMPTNSISSGNNDSCWVLGYTLSFAISDNSIGFGNLAPSGARYCTADTTGSGTEVEAHTITAATTAPSGYSISVRGSTLGAGLFSISAIGATNTASSPGTEQFGLRMTASGGSGTVSSPYAASGFAYAATSSIASEVASASTGDGATTTYSARYLANIAPTTESGAYTTNLVYIITANY